MTPPDDFSCNHATNNATISDRQNLNVVQRHLLLDELIVRIRQSKITSSHVRAEIVQWFIEIIRH